MFEAPIMESVVQKLGATSDYFSNSDSANDPCESTTVVLLDNKGVELPDDVLFVDRNN